MKKSLIWMILALIVPVAFVAMAGQSFSSQESGQDTGKTWTDPYTVSFQTESDGSVTVSLETTENTNSVYCWDLTTALHEIKATFSDGKWTASIKSYEAGEEITAAFKVEIDGGGMLVTKSFKYTVESKGSTPVDPDPVVDTTWRGNIGGGFWIFSKNGGWIDAKPTHDDNVYTFSVNLNNNVEQEEITALELTITGVSEACKNTFSTAIGNMTETMAKGFALQGSNGTWTGTMTNPTEYVYNNNGEMKMRVAIPDGCTVVKGFTCVPTFNDAGVIQSVAHTITGESNVAAEPKMTVSFDYANFERTSSTGGNITLNYALEGRSIEGTYIDVWVDITNNHNLITNGEVTGDANRLRLNIAEPTGSFTLALEGLDNETNTTLYPRVRWMAEGGSVIVDATPAISVGNVSTLNPSAKLSYSYTDWNVNADKTISATLNYTLEGVDTQGTVLEYFIDNPNLNFTVGNDATEYSQANHYVIQNPTATGFINLTFKPINGHTPGEEYHKIFWKTASGALIRDNDNDQVKMPNNTSIEDLQKMRKFTMSFWHGEFYTDLFKQTGKPETQIVSLTFDHVGVNGKWYYKYEFTEPLYITDSNQIWFGEEWTNGGNEYCYTDIFQNTGINIFFHPYFDARESDKWIKCSGNIDEQGNSRVRTGVKVKTIWVREDPTNLKQGVNRGKFENLEVYLSSDGSVDHSLTNYQTPENFDEYYLVAAKGTPLYNLMRGAGAPSDETELRIRFTKHAASEGYYQINLGRNLKLNAEQEFTFVIDPESKDEAEKTDVQFAATATDSFIPSSGAARSTISEGTSFSRIILYAAPKGRSTDMAYTLWLCEPDETGALTYPQGIEGYPDFNPRNLYSLPQLKIWSGEGEDVKNRSGYMARIPVKDESTGLFTEQHDWNNDNNSGFFGPGMAANQKVINASGNTYFVSFRPVIDNDADGKGSAKVSYLTDKDFDSNGSYTIPEGYRAVPNLFYIPLPGGVKLSQGQSGLTPNFEALDFFNLQGENGLTAGVPEAGGQWFYGNAWWCANPNVRYENETDRYMRYKPGTEGDLVVGEPMTVYGITLFRIVGNRWNMYSNREGDKFDDGNIYYLYFNTDPNVTGPELSCPILIDRIDGTEITPDEFDDAGNRLQKPDAFQWREIFYHDSRWSEGKPIDFNIPMHNNPEAKKLMYYGLAANGDAQYVCDFPKGTEEQPGGYRPGVDAPFRVIDASGTQIWYEDGEVLLPAKYSSYFLGRREHPVFNLLEKNKDLPKFQEMLENGCVGYDVNPVTGKVITSTETANATASRAGEVAASTTGALTLARPDVAYTRLILATNRDNLRVMMKASVPVIEANSNMIFEAPEDEKIEADAQPNPITPYANVRVTVPYNNEDVADGENGAINNKTIDIDLWFNGKTNADGSAKEPDFTGKFTVTIDKSDENGVALSGHATGEIDGRTVTFPVTILTEDRAGDDVYLNHGERILVFDMPFVIDTQDTAEGEEAFTMDNVVADVKIGLGGKNGSNNVQSQINVPEAKVEIKADDPTVSNNVMTNNEFHARLNWSSPNATGNLPKKYIVYSWAQEKVPADYPANFSAWTVDNIADGLSDGWLKVVYTGTSEKDAYRYTYNAISYDDTKDKETGTQALVNMHYGVVLTYNYQVPATGAPVMVSYPNNGSTAPVIDEDAQKLLTGKNVSASNEATLQYDLNKTVTGIDDIEAEEGEVIWYTVDGIRVAEPTRGRIYIRVANGHATSVLF